MDAFLEIKVFHAVPLNLFICDLFNNTVSNSDHIVLNDMINVLEIMWKKVVMAPESEMVENV
jgi:hypothetical protein